MDGFSGRAGKLNAALCNGLLPDWLLTSQSQNVSVGSSDQNRVGRPLRSRVGEGDSRLRLTLGYHLNDVELTRVADHPPELAGLKAVLFGRSE